MPSKIYTAQEMREQAIRCEHDYDDPFATAAMLRYAAEVVERCEEVRLDFHSCPDERDIINYILRGDAGKEEK